MRGLPGTLREGGAPFSTTHWSVIAAACFDPDGIANEETEKALAQLCKDYWPPLYSFARRRGFTPPDAQDLVQGFLTYFLQNRAYARVDSRKGKFRSFLLASFKHYMADVWDRERALKRGGGHDFVFLDEELGAIETLFADESVEEIPNEDRQYEQSWATSLVSRALKLLQNEFGDEQKTRLFGELKPFLSGGTQLPSQEQIARRLEMPVETLRSHLSRMRARYRELLREEVARTIGQADDVDEELHHLCTILTAAC